MDEPGALAGVPPPHQPDAIDARRIVQVALVLVVTLAVCIVASVWIAHGLARHYARPSAVQPAALPATAGPPLQPDPAIDLAQFRAQKEAALHGYRWVDRAHGIAQIPIDDAMRIIAQRSAASPGMAADVNGNADAGRASVGAGPAPTHADSGARVE